MDQDFNQMHNDIQSPRLASYLRKKHEKKTKYASFRQRSIAYSVDGLIVSVISGGISAIFKQLMPTNQPQTDFLAQAAQLQFDQYGNIIVPTETQMMAKTMGSGLEFASQYVDYNWPLFLINVVLVPLLYFSYFAASERQATPGMVYRRIYITDQYGARLTFAHAIGRTLCHFLTTLTLGIGFFTMIRHPKKRALHDIMAQTDVRNRLRSDNLPGKKKKASSDIVEGEMDITHDKDPSRQPGRDLKKARQS